MRAIVTSPESEAPSCACSTLEAACSACRKQRLNRTQHSNIDYYTVGLGLSFLVRPNAHAVVYRHVCQLIVCDAGFEHEVDDKFADKQRLSQTRPSGRGRGCSLGRPQEALRAHVCACARVCACA
eukprot:6214128-Pleurochrysis_carterae.AAC.3